MSSNGEAILNGTKAAHTLHRDLSIRNPLECSGCGCVDVFGAIGKLGVTLMFQNRQRIKQIYKPTERRLDPLFFPPRWKIEVKKPDRMTRGSLTDSLPCFEWTSRRLDCYPDEPIGRKRVVAALRRSGLGAAKGTGSWPASSSDWCW
jgi:hypothetical protein